VPEEKITHNEIWSDNEIGSFVMLVQKIKVFEIIFMKNIFQVIYFIIAMVDSFIIFIHIGYVKKNSNYITLKREGNE
jgi:hypothetical protein